MGAGSLPPVTSSDLPAGLPPTTGLAALPGLRTFASERFRLALAGLLLVIGIGLLGSLLLAQAAQPLEQGQYGIDFADYRQAAQRLLAGESPYAPEMLQGPIPAQGQDRYRYPPLLVQVLVPLAGLPLSAAATIWLVVQGVLIYAAVWVAGSAGGSRPSLERVLWTGVAVTYFLPVFDTLWKGNVSGVVAFQVAVLALGGRQGGASLATAILLKLTPAALLPAALVRGRRVVVGVAMAAAALVLASVLLSPAAWRDYAVVLPNLLAGSADYPGNLAPHVQLPRALPALEPLAGPLRLVTLAAGLGFIGLSVWLARRRSAWQAAIVAGTAALLLLPAALWWHYLVVLLPLAALAWAPATPRVRAALLAGGAVISMALAWLPMALAGSAVLVGAAFVALWPAED
jgi:hypothetical protein